MNQSTELESKAVDITFPNQNEVEVIVPGPDVCAGQLEASGVMIKEGYSPSEVRVLLLAGHVEKVKAVDVFRDGDSAIVEFEAPPSNASDPAPPSPPSPTKWRYNIMTNCESSTCQTDGRYTIAVIVKWQKNDFTNPGVVWEPNWVAEEDDYAASRRFTVKCKVGNLGKLKHDSPASDAWRVGDWTHYLVDLKAGNTLLGSDLQTPLRARKIACFVRDVEWQIHGLPWLTVRSPLGLLSINDDPGAIIAPLEPRSFIGAVLVQQNRRIVPHPDFPVHPKLFSVVASQSQAEPTVVDLDPRMDAVIRPNVIPGITPHKGAIVVAVKVLA